MALNERLKAEGKPPVVIRDAPENLEDDDLLEMVNAGLIPAIVVDDYLAKFWKQIFPNLTVHDGVAVRTGGTLAIAVRKNSPRAGPALNSFIAKFWAGNGLWQRRRAALPCQHEYAKGAASETERKKFLTMAELISEVQRRVRRGLPADGSARGIQRSQLNQKAKSAVGAIGVMQIMPATGAEQKVGDIRQLEPNIHAGVEVMVNRGRHGRAVTSRHARFASCGRVGGVKAGLDPNVWFGNVEVHRGRADRPRDRHLRREHLQVRTWCTGWSSRRPTAGRRPRRPCPSRQGPEWRERRQPASSIAAPPSRRSSGPLSSPGVTPMRWGGSSHRGTTRGGWTTSTRVSSASSLSDDEPPHRR